MKYVAFSWLTGHDNGFKTHLYILSYINIQIF